MTQREQFEEWVITQNVFKKYNAHLRKNIDGSYKDFRVNDRWNAWQASRANMPKIKLPDLSDFMETDYGWDGENETASDYFMEESCRKAIIAAIHEAGYEVEND